MIDYHLHSERSHDAEGSVLATCEAALAMGLTEICFTEHVDFEPTDPCYGYFDYDASRRLVDEAGEVYAGRLIVRLGAEFDFQAKYAQQMAACLEKWDFDYVVGAVHYVDGILLEHHEDYFPGRNAEEAYIPYLQGAIEAVRTGLFDSLAHFDLCKRHGVRYFGVFDPAPYADLIDETLRAMIEQQMSLEINSSGLRQAARDTYPCRQILERYHELGGRWITLGSDSHRLQHVGSGIGEALAMAKTVGFTEVSTYKGRKRSGKAI